MPIKNRAGIAWVVALSVLGGALLGAAKISVRAEGDKTFDFASARTWAWDMPTPGKVIMMRAADDDPEAVRKRLEPTVMEAVGAALQSRGLQRASASPPDLKITYYVVVKLSAGTQEAGQFLPATTFWGLPPFAPAATSFKAVQEGSLVIDMVASAKDAVVWRGIAETEVDPSKTEDQRKERIREGVRKLLEKYPPKK
jgi:hypothetical protein